MRLAKPGGLLKSPRLLGQQKASPATKAAILGAGMSKRAAPKGRMSQKARKI